MNMRKSNTLKKMKNGEVAIAIKLNLAEPRGVEIAAMSGFDCIWIDMEHVPNDNAFVENAVRAAKAHDCDVLTRVAKGSYNDFIHPLEADSTGIMIPHLMSLEEAKQVVYYTKFYPVGRRPLDGGNADGKYCLIPPLEYMKQANEERFVVVQIEDPEPLPELEEICALDGIDMIFFGPADFSQGIGTPCDFSNPEIDKTRRLVAEMAGKYGKFTGTTGNFETIGDYAAMGYNFVSIESDVTILAKGYQSVLERAKESINRGMEAK